MKKLWAGLVLVGAIIVGPLSVSASAASPPVVEVQTSAAVDLSNTGGVQTQVESLVLSSGSWTITSNLTAIDFGSGDFVRCHLQAGATDIDGGATVFLADRVAGIVNAGTVVASKKVTIGLFCDHDKNAATANQFYIDPGATIRAVEGGPIQAPGSTVPKPKVVEARTTTNTPLVENSLGAVTSVALPKGKWALKANGSAVNFGDFDFAACTISSSAGTVSENFVDAGNDGTDAAATNIDLEAEASVPAGGAVETLYCEAEFTSNTYIDAGATLTASKTAATVVQVPENTAISDTGGTPTTMVTQTMPAGSWRITSAVGFGFRNPNNSWGGSPDFVRCELQAGKHIIGSGQTQLITALANIQEIVNSATYTSSGSWTLKEVCSHDTTNTEPGHWTAEVGNLVAINQGPIG
jgi:hypothetical protein